MDIDVTVNSIKILLSFFLLFLLISFNKLLFDDSQNSLFKD